MGQEIDETRFTQEHFHTFSRRLKEETALLKQWLQEGRFPDEPARIGLELEAWLVDGQGRPAPRNAEVIARCDDSHLETELARYNLELNTDPMALPGRPFSELAGVLEQRWAALHRAAQAEQCQPALVGILPTVRESDLSVAAMSGQKRYQALNEQVLALRNRRPIHLDIRGEEHITLDHPDVMLESAATSLQLHLQVTPANAHRLFNAAVAASAATVGTAANSALLFDRLLWAETRIPLFEQAVAVTPLHGGHAGPMARVGFGSGYARDALYGWFVENRQHYPVLLPVLQDTPPEALAHLRLHNGTIWRWNRPLVDPGEAGTPHLRIEHRVMAAGPTLSDVVANAAFFYGLVHGLVLKEPELEMRLPFVTAQANFYSAARHGLEAPVTWLGQQSGPLRELILAELLPLARVGLEHQDVASDEIERWLGLIRERVSSGQTGAAWQRAWWQRHGHDAGALTRAMLEHQQTGQPVHRWPV